jgi:hypothetical protein
MLECRHHAVDLGRSEAELCRLLSPPRQHPPHLPEGVRTAGAELTKMALLRARIRAWLTLQSPPSQETFPYHLAFRQVAEGKLGEMKFDPAPPPSDSH